MKRRDAKGRPAAERGSRGRPRGPLVVAVLAAMVIATLGGLTLLGPAGVDVAASSTASEAEGRTGTKVGERAPDITFATTEGAEHRLSLFRGRPVMLWFFASWCPTCFAGTAAVAETFDRLERAGLQIIQLRLHENLGFPGPPVDEFAERYAGEAYPSPNWLWGEASAGVSFTYDPKGYPDIYYLIDEQGVIREINGAPTVTLDRIVAFAEGERERAAATTE